VDSAQLRGVTLPIVEPIRPVLSKTVPVGGEWRYELKLDGFRGVLYIENGRGLFRSKTSRVMRRFEALANGIARALPFTDAIFDGEIIALRKKLPDFAALMFRRGRPEYAAFDLLWLNGRDLRPMTYERRKDALLRALIDQKAVGYVESHAEPQLFDAAARLDLEGIVAKRVMDDYSPGARWLKVKHRGYTQNEGRWEMFRR
jgi:bifunctional non-homologous end joining protein LigD